MDKPRKSRYKFSLGHFVLFSKGWYRPVEEEVDSFQLYKRILALDGRQFVEDMNDVVMIVLTEFSSFNDFCKENKMFSHTILSFFNDVYSRMRLYKLDMPTAIVETVRSFFMSASGSDIILPIPRYDRKLYKKGIVFSTLLYVRKNGQTYKEQNRIAKDTFKDCQ